jgi:hypothetical protein
MKATPMILFFLCLAFVVHGQISVVFPEGKKATYRPGETLHVHIQLKSLPETCLDGMKQSKVFVQGLKIKDPTAWKQVGKGLFLKELNLEVLPPKKSTARLTILRKVDKENLFHQELFSILTNS